MSRAQMTSGPDFDSATGLVSGEIELPGGLPPEEPEETTGPRSSDAREMRDLSWAAAEEPGEATYARRADARHWEATARVLDELDAAVNEPARLAQVREWERAYLASDEERLAELGQQLWPDTPSLDDPTPYVESTGPEVQA